MGWNQAGGRQAWKKKEERRLKIRLEEEEEEGMREFHGYDPRQGWKERRARGEERERRARR